MSERTERHSIPDGASWSYNGESMKYCGFCCKWVNPDTDGKDRLSCPFCWNGFTKGSRYVSPEHVSAFYRTLDEVLQQIGSPQTAYEIYCMVMKAAPRSVERSMRSTRKEQYRTKLDMMLARYIESGKLASMGSLEPRYILADRMPDPMVDARKELCDVMDIQGNTLVIDIEDIPPDYDKVRLKFGKYSLVFEVDGRCLNTVRTGSNPSSAWTANGRSTGDVRSSTSRPICGSGRTVRGANQVRPGMK